MNNKLYTFVAVGTLLIVPAVAFGAEGFVPLTSIPGVEAVTSSGSIAGFLNQLYKICIGAAAVLAVLQITRGGLMYMTEESISEKKEARHLITMSILGLVLVLSPAIVFGLIDPRILELDVDVGRLQSSAEGDATGDTGADGAEGSGDGADTTTGDGSDSGDTTTTDSTSTPYTFTTVAGYLSVLGGPAYEGTPDNECYFMDSRTFQQQSDCAAWADEVEGAAHEVNPEGQIVRYRNCVNQGGGEVTINIPTNKRFCELSF